MGYEASPPFRRGYAWEFPVRAYHWISAACVVALIATGFLIGAPLAFHYSHEASGQYWFGTVRFVHFACAFVYFFNQLARIYWGFVGNRFAKWQNFIPHRAEQFKEI